MPWRESFQHLDGDVGNSISETELARAVMRYLSRVVYAHLEALLDSYPLPSDIDIVAFTDLALQDAQDHANSPKVAGIAKDARIYLLDASKVTYLVALAARKTRYASRSPFGSLDDGDYEKWSRAACEGFLTKFRSPTPEKRLTAVRKATEGGQTQGSRQLMTGSRPVGKRRKVEYRIVDGLKAERAALLAGYQTDTGVTSNWAIYSCAGPGTHSCHKPQFLQWKKGLLRPDSQSCISLETFLKERRRPPGRHSDD